jgi:hypothetical protein
MVLLMDLLVDWMVSPWLMSPATEMACDPILPPFSSSLCLWSANYPADLSDIHFHSDRSKRYLLYREQHQVVFSEVWTVFRPNDPGFQDDRID